MNGHSSHQSLANKRFVRIKPQAVRLILRDFYWINLGSVLAHRSLVYHYFGFLYKERLIQRLRQAVSKDLTSSSKFSGSCVLTLQTLRFLLHFSLYMSKNSRKLTFSCLCGPCSRIHVCKETKGLLRPGLDNTRLFFGLTAGAGTRCMTLLSSSPSLTVNEQS